MGLLSWLYVPKCTVCKKRLDVNRDIMLCDECLLKWEREKLSDCPICGQSAGECWCGIKLDTKGAIYSERHLSYYSTGSSSATKTMILSMKKKMNYALAQMLARELADVISRDIDIDDCVIVHIPRSKHSVKYYGFDQSRIIASGISDILDIPRLEPLLHVGKTVQKKLNLKERQLNAQKSYQLPKENREALKGKNVILIDDVVTTGATVSRCAALLKRAGANRIYVACIAKAY